MIALLFPSLINTGRRSLRLQSALKQAKKNLRKTKILKKKQKRKKRRRRKKNLGSVFVDVSLADLRGLKKFLLKRTGRWKKKKALKKRKMKRMMKRKRKNNEKGLLGFRRPSTANKTANEKEGMS
jgi:hypothetical protein